MNLQLNNGISNDLKKLDRYFKGTIIFAFSSTPLSPTAVRLPKILDLYLKDVELKLVTLAGFPLLSISCSSLLNYHRDPLVSA